MGVSAAGWESQCAAMDVTYTYNTQFKVPLINALKHATEQGSQQRQNGGDLTLWKSNLTRATRMKTQPYATTDHLTSSSSRPLNHGVETYPQKGTTFSHGG